MATESPSLTVMDSGLGGLSVVRALRVRAPQLPLTYLADTGGFPYGRRSAADLAARAAAMVRALVAQQPAPVIVIACNTLSTLCLDQLRAAFPAIRFVGTVPAVKTAAAQSQTRRFTLLATPNTAHSTYSRALVARFAADCVVDCYGAPSLAQRAEQHLLGQPVPDAAWREEIAPCFHDDGRGKTDMVVLGCTHYPLIRDRLEAQAPWPVRWVDSGDAIARQALAHCPAFPAGGAARAFVTRAADVAYYAPLFRREGLGATALLELAAASAAAPDPA